MIYGCNLAGSMDGQTLVDELSVLSGADVAASDDLTGSEELGGDWNLEYKAGEIETSLAVSAEVQDNWSGVLAATDNALWLSTESDVSNAGTPGIETWLEEEVVGLGDPNLSLGSTTNGTFSSTGFNLDNFKASLRDADHSRPRHYVTTATPAVGTMTECRHATDR